MITPVTLSSIKAKHISFKSMQPAIMTNKHEPQRKAAINYPKVSIIPPVVTVMQKSNISYNLFKAKLESIFFDSTRTETRTPPKAFSTIEYNKDRFENGISLIPLMKFKSGADAKKFINNAGLISARIILDNGTKSEGNRALTRLQKAIADEKIVVTGIKQYGVNENTDYASTTKLNAILEASNKAGYACTKLTNRKANGYHSIALKIKLEDGLEGNLEIMGKEVSKLKKVEDVLHLMEKGLPTEKKYEGLRKEFEKLSPEQYQQLKEYTKEAYIAARSDEMFSTPSDKFVKLTNPNLPQCFDFNNIAKI